MASNLSRAAAWLATVGVNEGDDDELRLHKSLLFAASAMVGVAAIVWGVTYLVLSEPFAASIPLGYAALSAVSMTLFARLRRYRLFRTGQLALMLVLPFLLSLALGGLIGSSGVVLWALITPLGALVFSGYREARVWFLAFLVEVLLSLFLSPLVESRATMSDTSIKAFAAMNILGPSTVAFILLQTFTVQRQAAIDTSEALLLNILPRRIADVLKKGPQTIAEHYHGALRGCCRVHSDVTEDVTVRPRRAAQRGLHLLRRGE